MHQSLILLLVLPHAYTMPADSTPASKSLIFGGNIQKGVSVAHASRLFRAKRAAERAAASGTQPQHQAAARPIGSTSTPKSLSIPDVENGASLNDLARGDLYHERRARLVQSLSALDHDFGLVIISNVMDYSAVVRPITPAIKVLWEIVLSSSDYSPPTSSSNDAVNYTMKRALTLCIVAPPCQRYEQHGVPIPAIPVITGLCRGPSLYPQSRSPHSCKEFRRASLSRGPGSRQ